MQEPSFAGATQCVGSGVPGDIWEFPHLVLPGTERDMFQTNPNGSGNRYFRSRCVRCQSTRYYRDRETCLLKAKTTFVDHAKKYCKYGFAQTVEQAKQLMITAGVTPEYIAGEVFVPAFGKLCPGLCCHAYRNDAGLVVIERHVISEYADLQLDWRDPAYPITPENIGPLCGTCNQQKGPMPWAKFSARQRAILANLEHVPEPKQPPEQFTLDDLIAELNGDSLAA